jgi:hypothetical protein
MYRQEVEEVRQSDEGRGSGNREELEEDLRQEDMLYT